MIQITKDLVLTAVDAHEWNDNGVKNIVCFFKLNGDLCELYIELSELKSDSLNYYASSAHGESDLEDFIEIVEDNWGIIYTKISSFVKEWDEEYSNE